MEDIQNFYSSRRSKECFEFLEEENRDLENHVEALNEEISQLQAKLHDKKLRIEEFETKL